MVKPFSLGELQARIEAHLRRERRIQEKREFNYDGSLWIDYGKRQLLYDGKIIDLTKAEFDIVELLSSYSGQVFNKEMIYEKLWGTDKDGDSRMVTEFVRRIRKKIKIFTQHEYIETVWGCGYKWVN